MNLWESAQCLAFALPVALGLHILRDHISQWWADIKYALDDAMDVMED